MVQSILLNQYNNELEKGFIKLFHGLGIPLHFNFLGRKGYSNYQRISIIILYARSGKSLRDFVLEFEETKWVCWLGLKKAPAKSTLHDWLKYFDTKIIRRLNSFLQSKNITLTAIDGTGIDSFHRSRHYEKRANEIKPLPPMVYAKADLFVDITTKKIIDFSLVNKHQHDIVAAKEFVARNNIKGFEILCDKGYDSEGFHRQVHDAGGKLYAPVRKRHKWSNKKYPKGWFRKRCMKLPEFVKKRSIIESINGAFKRRRLNSLRSRDNLMKEREFAWQVIAYNLDIETKIGIGNKGQMQISFYFLIIIGAIPDRAVFF
jgi:hypothetical protein